MHDPDDVGKIIGADEAMPQHQERNQEQQQARRRGIGRRAEEGWYGVQEAARFLGLHRSTLHLAIRRGRLTPDVYTPGRHARFRRTTLEAFQQRLVEEAATSEASAFAPTQAMATLAHLIASGQSLRAVCQAAVNGIIAVEPDVMCCITFRVTDQIDQLDTEGQKEQSDQRDQHDERLLGRRGSPTALRLYASEGFPLGFFRTFTLLRTQTNASFASLSVLQTREAEFCDDIALHSEDYPHNGTRRLLEEMGLRAYGITPIVVNGRAVGVLIVGSKLPHHFSLHERTFLLGITDQIANAIRMQRGRLRVEVARQMARTMLTYAFTRRAENRQTAQPPETSDEQGSQNLPQKSDAEQLVTLFTQQTGAIHVCALGFGPHVQVDPLEECQGKLLDLACAASAGDALEQKAWRDTMDTAYTALALSVPLASGRRGAVAALWRGDHMPMESEKLLLTAFAMACALLAEDAA